MVSEHIPSEYMVSEHILTPIYAQRAYIEANIPNEIDGINYLRSINAPLFPDVWILGENKQGELTMKPFSKGIPGWSELIKQQEHIVLEEFKRGTGPMRIDWLAHLI